MGVAVQLRIISAAGVLAVYWLLLVGCEKPTGVKITPGPSFEFSGSGNLGTFTVYAPTAQEKIANPFEGNNPVWRIEASKGKFAGARVNGLQVVYGKMLDGYTQLVPTSPGAAPTLTPGNIYAFWAETASASTAMGFFYMGNEPIPLVLQDLCFEQVNGHEVKKRCGNHEPYQEPTDIEEYVQEHRKAQ
jgi:hypothetical protein